MSIPHVYARRGELVQQFGNLDPVPVELDGFPWPDDIADAIKASDDAYTAISTAAEEWQEAHDRWEHIAPSEDQELLKAAIRAGEPDPGTPNTDAADRAEVVAWTRFEVVWEDQLSTMQAGRAAVERYLNDHQDHLAAYELSRVEALEEAKAKAAKIMAAATARPIDTPSTASQAMLYFARTRIDEHELESVTLFKPNQGDGFSRVASVEQHNEDVIQRWRDIVARKPAPTKAEHLADAKASELQAAADYGSKEAAGELKRRRTTPKV